MASKKIKEKEIHIDFIGNNSVGVTGSCTLISFNGRTIAFEMGGIQEGHTVLDNYKLNREMLQKIKAKDIDMIIGGHLHHYDHGGNVCSIFKQNPNIRIITGIDTTEILKEMWLDSARITQRDCEDLSKKYSDKVFVPYYDEDDAINAIQHVEEYTPYVIHKLDDEVSIRYTPSGHIFGAMQCEVFITLGNKVKKILFTSDLGNIKTEHLKPFVNKFEPVISANIAICETTYGSRENPNVTKKLVDKDLEKIRTVIDQYCVDNHARVLMPIFSLDKCPNVLWLIYQMFKNDENFKTSVVIDSPLTNRLLDVYSQKLQGEAKEKFDEMMSWKNIKRIVDPEESKAMIESKQSALILSSGGMLQSGRSVKWAASLLPRSCDCILFSGYCGENTYGWKIKNCQDYKTITLNGIAYKNKCQIVSLRTQSSHMQRQDLLNYYKQINCEKIYLVHGEMSGKIEFSHDLKEELSNCSKSTGVCVVNKGTKIIL